METSRRGYQDSTRAVVPSGKKDCPAFWWRVTHPRMRCQEQPGRLIYVESERVSLQEDTGIHASSLGLAVIRRGAHQSLAQLRYCKVAVAVIVRERRGQVNDLVQKWCSSEDCDGDFTLFPYFTCRRVSLPHYDVSMNRWIFLKISLWTYSTRHHSTSVLFIKVWYYRWYHVNFWTGIGTVGT
jgi:hypothetical protein